jgi:hypothetical protein
MTIDWTITAATPADDALVTDLTKASFRALTCPPYEETVVAAALPFMVRNATSLLSSGTYYLAESRDRPTVGCGGWTREQPGSSALGFRSVSRMHITMGGSVKLAAVLMKRPI